MGLYESLLNAYYKFRSLLLTTRLLLKQMIYDRHQKFDDSGIDCSGKVAIVTGGARGIGFSVVKRLVARGIHVIMASRNEERGRSAVTTIKLLYPNAKVEFQKLDLFSTASIRHFAQEFLQREIPLHYLVNNAGAIYKKLQHNEEGIEKTLMTNYVGHFLLTHLLLPRLLTSGTEEAHARIVHVSSEGHQMLADGKRKTDIDWRDLNAHKFFSTMYAYALSKAFQIMHGYKLQRLFHEQHSPVNAISVHPGAVGTDILNGMVGDTSKAIILRLFWTPDQAADVVVCAALNPALESRGILYLDNCNEVQSKRTTTYQGGLQDKLWVETCKMLNLDVEPGMDRWIGEVERVEKLFGVYQEDYSW